MGRSVACAWSPPFSSARPRTRPSGRMRRGPSSSRAGCGRCSRNAATGAIRRRPRRSRRGSWWIVARASSRVAKAVRPSSRGNRSRVGSSRPSSTRTLNSRCRLGDGYRTSRWPPWYGGSSWASPGRAAVRRRPRRRAEPTCGSGGPHTGPGGPCAHRHHRLSTMRDGCGAALTDSSSPGSKPPACGRRRPRTVVRCSGGSTSRCSGCPRRRRRSRTSSRTGRPMPWSGWSTGCWPRRASASDGRGTGWTSSATATRSATRPTCPSPTPGGIAITSSAPSTPTFPTIVSSSNTSAVTFSTSLGASLTGATTNRSSAPPSSG